MKSSDLPAALLRRKAVVYIRQSSPNQVIHNPESRRRQYELVEAARHHGFREVETIDDDLGRTASGMEERPGFDRLLTLMYEDMIGAVLCLDATRLSEATVGNCCYESDRLFSWAAGRNLTLADMTIGDVDEFLVARIAAGGLRRTSARAAAGCLRSFFRFAEMRNWCRPGIAGFIMPPLVYPDRPVPKGFDRDEVERLLATTNGSTPVDFRDRAVLTILATCGLRAGEVGALRVEDIDWERDMLRVFRSKTGRTDLFPLTDDGPRTPGHPMDAFAAEFLERYARHWKPSTLESSAYMVRNHILPAFGHMTVDAIAVEHVRDWFASMAGKPGSANRAMPILFDKSLTGFGLRIHPSGRKVWIVQARIEGRSRRIVIARHGEMELAQARRRARDVLARIRAGGNPADDIQREKETPTLRAFADEYLRRSEPHWKPSGRRTVRIYLKARILPAFGRMPLDRIGPENVAAWFDAASRDKPGAANRAFEILRAMMNRAEEWGLRERDTNPCLGIAKNPRNNVARFLDADELARLGRALDAHEARWPEAVAAIRLLALTGCRRSEVLNLRWRDIREDAIALEDSKTGPRVVPLGEAARALIEGLPGARKANAFLFPRHAEGRSEWSLTTCWRTVCTDAGVGRLRLHDLRHTAASQAVMAGENLPLVGKLLGHRRHRTTAGYAHLDDAHLVEAAERVGRIIVEMMTCGIRSRPLL